MMKNEELIKLCRLYKGEKKNPYTGMPTNNNSMIWLAEQLACNDYATNEELAKEDIKHYIDCGLLTFSPADSVPIIFKTALLRYYEHYYQEGTKGFKDFYLKEYLKESE